MEPVAVALIVLMVWLSFRIYSDWLARVITSIFAVFLSGVLEAASPKALVAVTVGAWLSFALYLAGKFLKLVAVLESRERPS